MSPEKGGNFQVRTVSFKCKIYRFLRDSPGKPTKLSQGCRFVPLYIFGNYPPQMVPRDLNIGFQGLAALIQGQIYNPVPLEIFQRIARPGGSLVVVDYCAGRTELSESFQKHMHRW